MQRVNVGKSDQTKGGSRVRVEGNRSHITRRYQFEGSFGRVSKGEHFGVENRGSSAYANGDRVLNGIATIYHHPKSRPLLPFTASLSRSITEGEVGCGGTDEAAVDRGDDDTSGVRVGGGFNASGKGRGSEDRVDKVWGAEVGVGKATLYMRGGARG